MSNYVLLLFAYTYTRRSFSEPSLLFCFLSAIVLLFIVFTVTNTRLEYNSLLVGWQWQRHAASPGKRTTAGDDSDPEVRRGRSEMTTSV